MNDMEALSTKLVIKFQVEFSERIVEIFSRLTFDTKGSLEETYRIAIALLKGSLKDIDRFDKTEFSDAVLKARNDIDGFIDALFEKKCVIEMVLVENLFFAFQRFEGYCEVYWILVENNKNPDMLGVVKERLRTLKETYPSAWEQWMADRNTHGKAPLLLN